MTKISRGLKEGVEQQAPLPRPPRALSANQTEILRQLTEEYETPKRIAIRLGVTDKAVYKVISKLKKKGYISQSYTRGLNKIIPTTPLQPSTSLKHGVRLHGQEFWVKVLNDSPTYRLLLGRKNMFFLDDNTVKISKGALEIYCNPHRCFLGEDEQRATSLSLQYWNTLFTKLETKLNVVIVKGESTCIKQVNGHYAEINNELAEDCNEKKAKIHIYTNDDGKLWFSIDNSWNLNEAETQHSKTAKDDMRAVKRVFNDIRDNNPPTLSEMALLIKQALELNKETAAGLNSVVQLMIPQPGEEMSEIKSDLIPTYIG